MNNDDIINLEHHISKKHKQMSMQSRAAAFAPFSALNGYEDEILEKQRLTSQKLQIDEYNQSILDTKLEILENNLDIKPSVRVTYFVKDLKKSGGKYICEEYCLRRIDKVNKQFVTTSDKIINFDDIINIESNLFKKDY